MSARWALWWATANPWVRATGKVLMWLFIVTLWVVVLGTVAQVIANTPYPA